MTIVPVPVDNFLRPYLISREAKLPLALIFLGVIGGILAWGMIGLFIGPTLLAVTFEKPSMTTNSVRRSRASTRWGKHDHTVLVLQGGGALGAYQAGAYAALSGAGIEPDWVAGVSIGAINATLIVGNPASSACSV